MNESYFDRVYQSTYRNLLKYAVLHLSDPADAEDALQTVYADFYRRIDRFGHLDILSPQAFLKRMLKHEIIKHYARRERREAFEIPDIDERSIPDTKQFENAVVDRALAEEVFLAAKELPSEIYRTFLLYYGFERSAKEIAKLLGVSEDAVKTRLHRARNILKTQFCERNTEENVHE